MIKVSVQKDRITIRDNSDYSVSGSDIVCASVSSIVITSINAILRIDNNAIKYVKNDGFIDIEILNHSKTVDLLIDNMISLLEELANQYDENIKIDK